MPGKNFVDDPIVSAERLEGARVVDPELGDLGRVLDVVVDLERGAIAYAIVARAEKVIALPWDELRARQAAFVLDGLEGP